MAAVRIPNAPAAH
ncbi:unnamed protein product, partial [Rotaria magnacalcarata]